ncbi:orotidine 5'-phosphate decarboxylase [Klebsiella pneumoniae]|nr:orotidine 5'-phosphate decarboxylase [Klebsiella pneumoniae]
MPKKSISSKWAPFCASAKVYVRFVIPKRSTRTKSYRADAKIADAGKILSRMCFEANADWVTVICCADINTAKGALDVAKEFNGDVQIELTGRAGPGNRRNSGAMQAFSRWLYHRSQDAQAAGVAWSEAGHHRDQTSFR